MRVPPAPLPGFCLWPGILFASEESEKETKLFFIFADLLVVCVGLTGPQYGAQSTWGDC